MFGIIEQNLPCRDIISWSLSTSQACVTRFLPSCMTDFASCCCSLMSPLTLCLVARARLASGHTPHRKSVWPAICAICMPVRWPRRATFRVLHSAFRVSHSAFRVSRFALRFQWVEPMWVGFPAHKSAP